MVVFEDINVSAHNLVPDFIKGVNSYTTKGEIPMLGIGLLLLIMGSILISAKKGFSLPKSLTFCTAIGVFISGMMVKIGFFTSSIFYISIILFVIAVIMLIAESNEP